MKFCLYCGKELNDDDRFCIHCGRLQESQTEQAGQKVEETEAQSGMMNDQAEYGQSQPAQAQLGQPQFGQPSFEQPQFDRSQFGQPMTPQNGPMNMDGMMNGQPQFGQPQFGQPQFGQPMPPQNGPMNMGGMMNGQPMYGQSQFGQPMPPQNGPMNMGGMMNGQPQFDQMQFGQPQFGQPMPPQNGPMNMGGMMNGQPQFGRNMQGGVAAPKRVPGVKPKKDKRQGGRKKKIIIISSIIGVLLLACGFILLFGFRKPTKEYLKDYFTGPDPNHEDVAGVPEYYHFWYYIQDVTGESGVYCRVTDVDIIDSEFSFFKGKARVKLTTEDEYLVREIYADIKLSGLAGNWNIDKVETRLDDPDNRIVQIKNDFYKNLFLLRLGYSNKYGLNEFEESRMIETSRYYYDDDHNPVEGFTVKYDVSGQTEDGAYDGYIIFDGYIDINPAYSDTDYRTNVTIDDSNAVFTKNVENDPGTDTGNDDNSGNNTANNNTGNSTGNNDNSGNNTANNNTGSNDNGNNAANNNPVEGLPAITDEKIYIYSWNNEFGNLLDYFTQKYPEYSDLIEFINMGMNGADEEYLDAVSSKINSSSQPLSMVMYDGECADQLYGSRFISMSELGVEPYYTDAYDYTKVDATYDGKLKGMSPYVCPTGFIYRKDIAEEVLGTSDPEEVYKCVCTWDIFEDTAAKMKDSGYYMLYTTGDLARGYGGTTWEGNVPDACFQQIDRFVSNGYFADGSTDAMWSTAWNEGMNSNVFGYFGPDWFINFTLAGYTTKEWGFCPGPEFHHWGGAYIGVAETCPNKGLAALILVTICCDEDIQYDFAVNNYYTPNNRSAAKKLISSGAICYNTNVLKTPIAKYNDEIAANIER